MDITKPYLVKGKSRGRMLVFIGSEHSNDPSHQQWKKMKVCFQEFLENSNTKKYVFVEGGVRPLRGSLNEMIIQDGDPGFAQFCAAENHIPYSSPEIGITGEVNSLLGLGYTPKQIIAYYFARQLDQWARGDKKHSSDWRVYMTYCMNNYAKVHSWGDEDLSLEGAIRIYEEVYGHKLEPENRDLLNNESNPGLVPLVSASSQLRDRSLFTAIYEKWQDGSDVFVVYGSGHAIVLEPALLELTNE